MRNDPSRGVPGESLDARAQHLLKTLVERYIAEGQPVGSRALSRHSGLDLSPATIRNVMADLEEMGFVASPHTSAGWAFSPTFPSHAWSRRWPRCSTGATRKSGARCSP